MEIERDVTIEQEADDESAADRQSSYTTFIGAASSMPRFSDEELDSGLAQMAAALEEIEAESDEPVDEEEPVDEDEPADESDDLIPEVAGK